MIALPMRISNRLERAENLTEKANLVLEDGSVYEGYAFGAEGVAYGEVVFNTAMTGYQEMLTDPSYAGQILVATYPLIGNYGINSQDFESRKDQVSGFVVREQSLQPSHYLSDMALHDFLRSQGIPAISGVDTRAITRRIRTKGVMLGTITSESATEGALARLKELPEYDSMDFVTQVTTEQKYTWDQGQQKSEGKYRILVSDFGLKYNILRAFHRRGFEVVAYPAKTSAEDILAQKPDGVILSPGPGDPSLLAYAVQTAQGLIGRVPIMGICLGHQVLGRALGGTTFKLKFGHRGANHPVQDLATGLVSITAQNHGYAIDADSLSSEVEVSHVSLNDGTVEGLRHKSLPVFSIQYHSEASPGPQDNDYLFDKFTSFIDAKQ